MISKDAIVSLYQSIKEANEDRVYEAWHASSIATCPRSHYFQRLGIKGLNEPTGAKILRWGAGHHLEKSIRPHIEKLYPGVGSNERMTSTKMDMTGEFDNYSEKLATLIEVKSVSDYAFWEEGADTGLKEECGTYINPRTGKENKKYQIKRTPYLHHEVQQHSYKLLLEELGKPVKYIDYVYISLNGRIVVYKTEPDAKVEQGVKDRLSLLNEAWRTKTPPQCICTPNHKLWGAVLQWCDYRTEAGCCDLKLIKKEG